MPPMEVNLDAESGENEQSSLIVKWVIVLLAVFQTQYRLTDNALTWLLKFLSVLFKALATILSKNIAYIAEKLPKSLYKHNKATGDISLGCDSFEKRAVCSSCCALYKYDECLSKHGSTVSVETCNYKPFRNSKRCGELLMKEIVSCSGNARHYPHQVYCFTSLISGLQNLILRSQFLEQCMSTRSKISTVGYADVYDGKIWKEFQTDKDGNAFLSTEYNYGLLMNVDWFQPFKHTVYSVGVIYITFLNLPRLVRFKRENVIIIGIIPGPREPSLHMNTFLSPLVSNLLDLWKGVDLKLPDGNTVKSRCALLGVSCDLPAGRKVCGFLSYMANFGCTRCYQEFSLGFGARDYSNFDRSSWKLRTREQHRSDVNRILKCPNKTQKSKMESECGCRSSVLLDLPYFDPVRMLLLDPMHNLFLGTAKHMVYDIWIGQGFLSKSALDKIEVRLHNIVVPTGLGRLPVSVAIGRFLTAEQWKNWTLYYSIYSLHDLLPVQHLECWRHFVLACQKLCPHEVSENDVTVADLLLHSFCKKVLQLYGPHALTPNMHIHCHLAACCRDFGPLHSYWCFPFERYNGVLGNQPTNNRSIELQLMRRFMKDNSHLQLTNQARHWPFSDLFLGLIPGDEVSTIDDYTNSISKFVIGSLSTSDISILKMVYSKLYTNLSEEFGNGIISLPTTYKKFASLKWKGSIVSSHMNRSARNCLMLAKPMFVFTTATDEHRDYMGDSRPANILYFLQHSIVLPGSSEPKFHFFVRVTWPMIHPNQFDVGKPVEVWCDNLDEPDSRNSLLPVINFTSRVIFTVDRLFNSKVLVVIPVIDN